MYNSNGTKFILIREQQGFNLSMRTYNSIDFRFLVFTASQELRFVTFFSSTLTLFGNSSWRRTENVKNLILVLSTNCKL